MSLTVICSECNQNCGYFTGRNIKIGDLEPTDGNEISNVFSIGKVVGHAGATFSNLKTENDVFICRNCLKEKMPNAYKCILERINEPESKIERWSKQHEDDNDSENFNKIRYIVSEKFDVNVNEISLKSKISDLSKDSLDDVDFVMALEDEFNIEISDETCLSLKTKTIEDIFIYVKERDKKCNI